MWQNFAIVGSGFYLPRLKRTAEEIDRRAGLPLGWTETNTGVLVRYECAPPESLASMAQEAIASAMHEADVDWGEVDLILDASASRHQPIPCNSACLQHAIGKAAHGIPCMDVQSTCLGFILAVHVANALFASGSYRHILLVCSEAALQGVDWNQPESACLMGDGAAAVLLRSAEPTPSYFFAQETFAQHLDACEVRGGAHRLPPPEFCEANATEYLFQMDGSRLLRAVGKHLPPMTKALMEQADASPESLHVLPHQAGPKALELVRRLLGFPTERFPNRVAQMGNLVSAGVPAVLHLCRNEGQVTAGDQLLLLGTSAGYSQAGLICRL